MFAKGFKILSLGYEINWPFICITVVRQILIFQLDCDQLSNYIKIQPSSIKVISILKLELNNYYA